MVDVAVSFDLLTIVVTLLSPSLIAGKLMNLITFGDSVSDNGIDASGFFIDTHGFQKFSNGPIWTEYLGQTLRINPQRYRNYAYSGGMSNTGNYYGFNWSGVEWQVNRFFELYPRIPLGTLIAYQAGGCNDFFGGIKNASLVALTNARTLRRLARAGARWIVVADIYDCSFPPGVKTMPELQKNINDLTTTGNRLLKLEINRIHGEFPNLKICLVSFQQTILDILNSGVYKNDVFKRGNDTMPGETYRYIWFDDYHPATVIHKILAEAALRALINC